MLHIIGIGTKKEHLNFESLNVIKKSCEIFLEYYTCFYQDDLEELEKFIGKKIEVCTRYDIEYLIEKKILQKAKNKNIALLIIGDPLIATTHIDILFRCEELKIKTKIYNNISIANLIANTGLQFYKFGKITSIPFFSKKFMPETPYKIFLENQKIGAHTLFLLDLNPSNDKDYITNEKYLKVEDALNFLIEISKKNLTTEQKINKDTFVLVCSCLGFSKEKILYNKISYFLSHYKSLDLKPPLCIIIPKNMHEMEEKFLKRFKN